MLVRALLQNEKRQDYDSTSWQPEPGLAQPPPRTVSFSTRTKLLGAFILLAFGLMTCVVSLPSFKHAYLVSYGVPTKGAIQQRYSYTSGGPRRRNNSYFLLVRFETSSGWQLVKIQTSKQYYARNFQGELVPIHYLKQSPPICVLDDDHLYQTWQVFVFVGIGVTWAFLQLYIYRKMKALAESGQVIKGLITKVNKRLKYSYLTVYYEFQGDAYQGEVAVRAYRARPEWQVGGAITLLAAPDPPPSPSRPHVAMVYPAPEFRINS